LEDILEMSITEGF